MKISVVTPTFNQSGFIEETIESVWSQKGNFEIEHIVMDGGSSDDTVKVLKKWEWRLKNGQFVPKCKGLEFAWSSEKDRGQTHAINKGMRLSTGKVLAYINSDDAYRPEAFSKAMGSLAKRRVDFVCSDCEFINSNGKRLEIRKSRRVQLDALLDWKDYVLQPTVFWSRKAFSKLGEFDEELYYAMDYDYWIRALKAGFKFEYLKGEVLAQFRVHEDSKSVSGSERSWKEARKVARKHGGRFYSLMLYMYVRGKLVDWLNGWNVDGAKLIDSLEAGKRKMVGDLGRIELKV